MKLSFFYVVSALVAPLSATAIMCASCSKTEIISTNLFDYSKFSDPGDYTQINIDGIGTVRQYSFLADWPIKGTNSEKWMPTGDDFYSWLFPNFSGFPQLPKPNQDNINIESKYFKKIIDQITYFSIKNANSNSSEKQLKSNEINWKTIGTDSWGQAKLTYFYKNDQKSLSIICTNKKDEIQVNFNITEVINVPNPPTLTPTPAPPSTSPSNPESPRKKY